jgi:hypothetical protein
MTIDPLLQNFIMIVKYLMTLTFKPKRHNNMVYLKLVKKVFWPRFKIQNGEERLAPPVIVFVVYNGVWNNVILYEPTYLLCKYT